MTFPGRALAPSSPARGALRRLVLATSGSGAAALAPRWRALALWGCALGALAACGEEAAEAPTHTLERDARAIAEIAGTDPAASVLDDVDRAIDTDRPVLGADLLGALGLPAMRRQVTRLEDLRVSSADGRTLRARAIRLYRARVTAYEAYQRALVRGLVDDDALLDALDDVSENERELLALQYELSALAPFERGAESEASGAAASGDDGEERALAGLPPVRRETSAPDDETPGGEPEGRLDDPSVLEDALPEM